MSHSGLIPFSDDDSERLYLARLDNCLLALATRPSATLENVIRGARGAFPTIVLERLRALKLDRVFPGELEASVDFEGSVTGPELHPLDYEWYFAPSCADDLARILANPVGDALCLSTPTVAIAVASRGQRALLVDRNPLILGRLPSGLAFLQFILSDLFNPLPLKRRFPVVFFDAPWYPEHTSFWLWQASQAVCPGGLIAFALFPPLLRPGAEHERFQLLEQASILGRVEVMEEVLSYKTPLFEQEALAQCGVRMTTNWRCGDLVLVHVSKIPESRPPVVGYFREKWDSFLLGQQVVKLRRSTQGESGFVLAPIRDCLDYVFPTVSRRDPRISEIDLWTSRNRVAQVGRRDIVSAILVHLGRGLDLDALLELPQLSSYNLDGRKRLISDLRSILGFPLAGDN